MNVIMSFVLYKMNSVVSGTCPQLFLKQLINILNRFLKSSSQVKNPFLQAVVTWSVFQQLYNLVLWLIVDIKALNFHFQWLKFYPRTHEKYWLTFSNIELQGINTASQYKCGQADDRESRYGRKYEFWNVI